MSKTINIKDLLPILRKGWVAMDEDGSWIWSEIKPEIKNCNIWELSKQCSYCTLTEFINILPVPNWKESLIEVRE